MLGKRAGRSCRAWTSREMRAITWSSATATASGLISTVTPSVWASTRRTSRSVTPTCVRQRSRIVTVRPKPSLARSALGSSGSLLTSTSLTATLTPSQQSLDLGSSKRRPPTCTSSEGSITFVSAFVVSTFVSVSVFVSVSSGMDGEGDRSWSLARRLWTSYCVRSLRTS